MDGGEKGGIEAVLTRQVMNRGKVKIWIKGKGEVITGKWNVWREYNNIRHTSLTSFLLLSLPQNRVPLGVPFCMCALVHSLSIALLYSALRKQKALLVMLLSFCYCFKRSGRLPRQRYLPRLASTTEPPCGVPKARFTVNKGELSPRFTCRTKDRSERGKQDQTDKNMYRGKRGDYLFYCWEGTAR